jgi:cytochrome c-type biogenesis protein CcmH/NrfG
MAHFGLQRKAEAIRMFEPYLGDNPGDARAWFFLGAARMDRDPGGAVDALKRCLAVDAQYRDAHSALAACYTRLGDHARARRHQQLYRQGK